MLRLVGDFSVKTVDLKDSKWPELLAGSLKKTGFAVIKNHDLNPILLEVAYKQWAEFFASDRKLLYKSEEGNKGYIPFKAENAKGSSVKDLKEFYHAFYPFELIPNNISLGVTKEITNKMLYLARHILFVLQPYVTKEQSLIHGQPLHNMIKESKNNLLRTLHYPPIEGEVELGAIRAAAHEDINLITILPAATKPGLEVLDLDGNWHKIECDPGCLIVNVGDMLQEATDGYFKSTTHRVVNPEGENTSRYSMPLFVHPRSECRLSERYTAQEYLEERLKEIGLKK